MLLPAPRVQDAYRRFRGPEGYQRLDFVPASVSGAAVSITGMRMLDNSAAEIRWRLTGKLGPLPVDVAGRWRRQVAGSRQPARMVLARCR